SCGSPFPSATAMARSSAPATSTTRCPRHNFSPAISRRRGRRRETVHGIGKARLDQPCDRSAIVHPIPVILVAPGHWPVFQQIYDDGSRPPPRDLSITLLAPLLVRCERGSRRWQAAVMARDEE